MEWQPIETAPKDGTPVLFYSPIGFDREGGDLSRPPEAERITIGWWGVPNDSYNPSAGWVSVDPESETFGGSELTGSWTVYELSRVTPTHWMPLPDPPVTSR